VIKNYEEFPRWGTKLGGDWQNVMAEWYAPGVVISPEKDLAIAMIYRAQSDLAGKDNYGSDRHPGQSARIYNDAVEWIKSEDRTWPYSFANCCEMIGFNAGRVRKELLGARP
jgi:hypothetical protein